jgi:hypothetical protein
MIPEGCARSDPAVGRPPGSGTRPRPDPSRGGRHRPRRHHPRMPPAVAARVRPGLDPVPDRSVALHEVPQPMVAVLARPEPQVPRVRACRPHARHPGPTRHKVRLEVTLRRRRGRTGTAGRLASPGPAAGAVLEPPVRRGRRRPGYTVQHAFPSAFGQRFCALALSRSVAASTLGRYGSLLLRRPGR